MEFDPQRYSFPSRRNVVYGKKGMVATSQPLAAQAGLEVLKKGGNAIDAAIATAACLTVVEPTSNGIGGDAFALVWVKDKLYGLNGSGVAPNGISISEVKKTGAEEMPKLGWIPVTVPGAPGAWVELSERFGKLPLTEVLAPAISYAEEGHAVAPIVAKYWQRGYEIYKKQLPEDIFNNWAEVFAPEGRSPLAGEIWKSPDHGRTLRLIAETKGAAFYKGELADKIDYYSRRNGGFIRKEDLENHRSLWVDPIHVNYKGYDVWEIPPNGQGIIALMALNILKGLNIDFSKSHEVYHKQIEALKLAFADGHKYITDGNSMKVTIDELLSEAYGRERSRLIGNQALTPVAGEPPKGGTVYLATADGEGNMVSFIQSNYMGFGSGVVVPGTGISLQNRGNNFSLDEDHVNALMPGKRTYHTIIPGFLTKGGEAVGPFGVMGGFMQPQGHLQVIMNTIDFNMNPQEALDAPRWQWMAVKTVEVEAHMAAVDIECLHAMGHDIKVQWNNGGFGRGQIIWRTKEGSLVGGTEGRADGAIAAW